MLFIDYILRVESPWFKILLLRNICNCIDQIAPKIPMCQIAQFFTSVDFQGELSGYSYSICFWNENSKIFDQMDVSLK